MNFVILDIATTLLPDAAAWIQDDPIDAPANYKDPQKIADYIAGKKRDRIAKAALDPDCCCLSMLGTSNAAGMVFTRIPNEATEASVLRCLAAEINAGAQFVTFNGFRFDLPVLARRAMYLGADLGLELDRYKTPHVDLYEKLTHRGLVDAHGLGWYVRRFGWTDLCKPLSGAEEAMAPQEGRWEELEASVRHDVIATARLAEMLRVIPRQTTEAA